MTESDGLFRKAFLWACKGPMRFVVVAGLGAYGLTLGIALSLFLALRGHLHGWLGFGVSFVLGEMAGLLFGIGMWLLVIRKVRNLLDGKASPRR